LSTQQTDRIALVSAAVHHPERQAAWVIVLLAHLAGGSCRPDVVAERLHAASADFPLIASRLQGKWWTPSTCPAVSVAAPGVVPLEIAPIEPFDLQNEPPLRVVLGAEGSWLLMCAHHFAIDGLGMVSLMGSLLTGKRGSGSPDYTVVTAPRRPPTDAVLRLIRPADRIAPSVAMPSRDTFVSASVHMSGPHVTARISRACAEGAREHNRTRGLPLRRFGLSLAVRGPEGEGATYRRIDVSPDQDIESAVAGALSDPAVPVEVKGLPPGSSLLRPLLKRLSDTVLVSNLGRLDLPVNGLELYPQARGRSAVAVGAAGIDGQPTIITLRARDLDRADATSLLQRIVARLE
jgi:hypothetical protein